MHDAHYWKALKLEHELKVEKAARGLILEELSKIQNLQTPRQSPFGPTPRECLDESIQNEVEKRYFWEQHREAINVRLEARD